MKKIKFLLIVIAFFGISSMFSCNGSGEDESVKDTTTATDEPVTPEETVDTVNASK
jgi:hypothetical protein